MLSAEEKMSYAHERGIRILLHFTKLSNLQSIMENGILSRDGIDNLESEPEINDQLRLDNHTDTISVSIAHPNSQMFYKYRNEKGGDWCVIGIHPKVLWEKECLFCKHNAADARIISKSSAELAKVAAFKGIYDEIDGHASRDEQCLEKYDPTDVQAEILVKHSIEPDYIVGVVFPNRIAKKQYKDLTESLQTKVHMENKGYYASRSYRRKYQ